jgi:hypothetical protein
MREKVRHPGTVSDHGRLSKGNNDFFSHRYRWMKEVESGRGYLVSIPGPWKVRMVLVNSSAWLLMVLTD